MRTVASWGDAAFAERIARGVGVELAALGHHHRLRARARREHVPREPRHRRPRLRHRRRDLRRVRRRVDPRACSRRACSRAASTSPATATPRRTRTSTCPSSTSRASASSASSSSPFRAAAAAGVATLMTAHVVYPALDAERPATLSRAVCTDLRDAIGFRGLLVSDDLEMRPSRPAGRSRTPRSRPSPPAATLFSSAGATRSRSAPSRRSSARPSASPAFRRDARRRAPVDSTLGAAARRGRSTTTAWRASIGGAESRAIAAEMQRRAAT